MLLFRNNTAIKILKEYLERKLFLNVILETPHYYSSATTRSSSPEIFLRKCVLKMRSKSTGEHPCRSVVSIKLLCNIIEITFQHGCSTVKLLQIFKTPIPKNTSGGLLLHSCRIPRKIEASQNVFLE